MKEPRENPTQTLIKLIPLIITVVSVVIALINALIFKSILCLKTAIPPVRNE